MKHSFFKRWICIMLSVIMAITSLSIVAFAVSTDVTVVTAPSKTTFYQGEDWNWVDNSVTLLSSMDFTGTKLKYGTKTYSYAIDDLFGPNMYAKSSTDSWAVGSNTAYIYCDDIGSSHCATITFNFVSISKIEIIRTPILTDLIKGTHWKKGGMGDVELSSYDMTGVQLKVTYSDSSTKVISAPDSSLGWSVDADADYIYPGAGKLYITYAGQSIGFDVNFLETAPSYNLGDVNRDSKVSSYDALLVLEYAVGQGWFNNTQLTLADVSKDSNINSTDALYILQKVVGIKTSF